jgi:chitinase
MMPQLEKRRLLLPAAVVAAALAAGCADLTYDATPPYVAVLYPTSWSTLGQDTITVRADAYDNRHLARVVFYADGESLAAVTAAPFEARWFPDTFGGHTLHCVAWDEAGNEAHTPAVVVTIVDNAPPPDLEPPYVAVVRPASWSVVSDTARIEAVAADNRGVSAVTFFLDGDSLATRAGPSWQHYWDSRSVGDGYHTIYAVASDSSGNRAYSFVVTVDVRNAR